MLLKSPFFLFLFLSARVLPAQSLIRRPVPTDTTAAIMHIRFDAQGSYVALATDDTGGQYLSDNHHRSPSSVFVSTTTTSRGSIQCTLPRHSDTTGHGSQWYYANSSGTWLYGPMSGRMIDYADGRTANNTALLTRHDGYYYTYINGILRQKLKDIYPSPRADRKSSVSLNCAFSPGGNALYVLHDERGYILYLNDSILYRSLNPISSLHVTDSRKYLFVTCDSTEEMKGFRECSPSLHTPDTVLRVWKYAEGTINEQGGYYFTDDYNIVINNHTYRHLSSLRHILLAGTSGFFIADSSRYAPSPVAYAGNRHYSLPYDSVFGPTLDDKGNFALFGHRKDSLYRYINGRADVRPLSTRGGAARPIYIRPGGEALYYSHNDSLWYVYGDDGRPLFPPKPPTARILLKDLAPLLGIRHHNSEQEGPAAAYPLIYYEQDSAGHIIFKGQPSSPGPALNRSSSDKAWSEAQENGQIITGEMTGDHFFIIQKAASRRFLINIDNRVYKVCEDIEKIVPGSAFLSPHQLIFYGSEGAAFYQYTLSY